MTHDTEKMIAMLSPDIDQKCAEIREARREKFYTRLFIFLCTTVIMIPTSFVFLGISLITLLIPAVFTAAAFLLLSPILISQQGGRTYDQA